MLCSDYHESLDDLLGGPVAISICDSEQAIVMAGPIAHGFPQGANPTKESYQQQRHDQAHRHAQDHQEATRIRQAAIASLPVHPEVSIAPLGVVYSLADLRKVGMLGADLHLRTPPAVVSVAGFIPEVAAPQMVAPAKPVEAPVRRVTFQGHLPYSVSVHWQTEAAMTTGTTMSHEPLDKIALKSAMKPTDTPSKSVVTYAGAVRNGVHPTTTNHARKQRSTRRQAEVQAKAAAAAAVAAMLPKVAAQTKGHPFASS